METYRYIYTCIPITDVMRKKKKKKKEVGVGHAEHRGMEKMMMNHDMQINVSCGVIEAYHLMAGDDSVHFL